MIFLLNGVYRDVCNLSCDTDTACGRPGFQSHASKAICPLNVFTAWRTAIRLPMKCSCSNYPRLSLLSLVTSPHSNQSRSVYALVSRDRKAGRASCRQRLLTWCVRVLYSPDCYSDSGCFSSIVKILMINCCLLLRFTESLDVWNRSYPVKAVYNGAAPADKLLSIRVSIADPSSSSSSFVVNRESRFIAWRVHWNTHAQLLHGLSIVYCIRISSFKLSKWFALPLQNGQSVSIFNEMLERFQSSHSVSIFPVNASDVWELDNPSWDRYMYMYIVCVLSYAIRMITMYLIISIFVRYVNQITYFILFDAYIL